MRLPFVLLLGMAGAAHAAPPVQSLLEQRTRNVIVQKFDVSCGAAALATLLTFQHRHSISEESVARGMLRQTDALRVKHRGGFSLLDLKRFADGLGFEADAFEEVDEEALQKMAPAIVPIDFHGYPHFVIYRGQVGNDVLLADPAFGNRVIAADLFASIWQKNIAFVVQRPNGSPAAGRLPIVESDLLRVPSGVLRHSTR
jgi:predicted double-glycine peptidase